MATTPDHITITVDEGALREQVQGIVNQELIAASWRLRAAADALYPGFHDEQDKWQESEIERRVKVVLDLEKAEAKRD